MSPARSREACGVLVLDKAAGITSAKTLSPLKAAGWKVGHAGTLDPFATGVLLALVGDATRLSALAMSLEKHYRAVVSFGTETDTLDPEGAVVRRADPGSAAPPGLAAAVSALRGNHLQTPPAFSALKVEGRRAYRLARAGTPPDLAARPVHIESAEIEAVEWPEVVLQVACGAGTYLRAVARDLGAALGLPAHLTALRRARIGPFRAEEGLRLDPEAPPAPEEWARRLVDPRDLARAANLPFLETDLDAARRFAGGMEVSAPHVPPEPGSLVAVVLAGSGRLVGLGVSAGRGRLRPRTVLSGARRHLEASR